MWSQSPEDSCLALRRRERAFTLIEVVIAISILSIIVGITYLSLRSIVLVKVTLDDRRDSDRIAQAILNRLSKELQLAFSGIPLLLHPDESKQSQLTSKIKLLGEPKSLSTGERGDTISFVALEGGQYLPDGGAHSGVVQITYHVEPDPDNPESKTFYLVRNETPVIRPEERAKQKTMIFPVTKNLVSLSFRYFDREADAWTDQWGNEGHVNLPPMIEFSFKISSPRGDVDTFTSAVALRSIY